MDGLGWVNPVHRQVLKASLSDSSFTVGLLMYKVSRQTEVNAPTARLSSIGAPPPQRSESLADSHTVL